MTPLSIGLKVQEQTALYKDSFVGIYETSTSMEEVRDKMRPLIEAIGKEVLNAVLDGLYEKYYGDESLNFVLSEERKNG